MELKIFNPNQENDLLICHYMGCKTKDAYTTRFGTEYSVRGKMVENFREKGLRVCGYKDAMMVSNCAFGKDWNWIFEVRNKIIEDNSHWEIRPLFSFDICKDHVSIKLMGYENGKQITKFEHSSYTNDLLTGAYHCIVSYITFINDPRLESLLTDAN